MFNKTINKPQLAELQKELARKVLIPPEGQGYQPQSGDTIFSLDAQYRDDKVFVALDIHTWGGKIPSGYVALTRTRFPYLPMYFCFREGPPLLEMINIAHQRLNRQPDLIIVNGHGIAHPRRFGLACWIGVKTDIPTIGCAKGTIIRYEPDIKLKRGNVQIIKYRDEIVGSVLVTHDNTKPVYVSPGHKISLKTATDIILKLSPHYRAPEPLRRADHYARTYAKGLELDDVTFWGEIG